MKPLSSFANSSTFSTANFIFETGSCLHASQIMRDESDFCNGKLSNAKVIPPLISVDDLLSLNSAHSHKHIHFAWTTVAASGMSVFEQIQLLPFAIGILIHTRVSISARRAKTVQKLGIFRFWTDSIWGRLRQVNWDYKLDAKAFNL